jgi:hypothetical protein
MRNAALVTVIILASGYPALGDPLRTDAAPCAADPQRIQSEAACPAQTQDVQRAKTVMILPPVPGLPGDIHGGRGPDPHARELREIAMAASVGNLEKSLIGTRELHDVGVTREAVQDAIDQAQMHTGNLRAAKRRFFVIEQAQPGGEPGWENSQ